MNDLSKKLAKLLLLGDTGNSYKLIESLLFEGFTSLYIYVNHKRGHVLHRILMRNRCNECCR